MNIDILIKLIGQQDQKVLAGFILNLYNNYPELDKHIETLAMMSDPKELTKSLKKRIQSLKRGRKFIDYRAAFSFSRDLDMLLGDIKNGLLTTNPENAYKLTKLFLETAPSVLNRLDDSSGAVSDVYKNAVLLWLTAASAWGSEKENWLDHLYELYETNDYGVLDPLLSNSHILLTKEQLQQLAWRYESQLRKALKQKSEHELLNSKALHFQVALGQVARALKDPELYERSILIATPKPNDLLKKSIITMHLEHRKPKAALDWLTKAWDSRFEIDRLELLDQAYGQLKDKNQQIKIRRKLFEAQQTHTNLVRYMELLDDDEKKAAHREAVRVAESGKQLIDNARLLLMIGESEKAEQLIVTQAAELSENAYNLLLRLTKRMEQHECHLGTTACYRALLIDILNQGRSKAYGHGARYLKKLNTISAEIKNYAPLENHQDFVSKLKKQHGLKKSFWSKVKQE